MRHTHPIRFLAITAALTITAFSNCGRFAQSRSYEEQRAATISSSAVFSVIGRDAGRTPQVEEPNPPPTEPPVNPPPVTPPPVTPPPPITPPVTAGPSQIPVELYCSQDGLSVIGSALAMAPPNLIYGFVDGNGAEVCSFSEAGARDDVINTNRVTIGNLAQKCPALRDGDYVMTMRSPTGGGSLLMTILNMGDVMRGAYPPDFVNAHWIGNPLNVRAKIGSDKTVNLTVTSKRPCDDLPAIGWLTPASCLGIYGDLPAKVLSNTLVGGLVPAYARCDHWVSPLILRLGDTNEGIQLSPPLQGIDFDIMGINSVPPYKPKRISWFTDKTAQGDYFLVLPNARGEVLGIDQMFGDNTLTPDGHKPPKDWNGYAALGLFDGRRADGSVDESARDNFITERDEVFGKLRLWRDANRDGVAQPEELSTLAEHDIDLIDLRFSDSHPEVDKYGNESRMRSTARTRDGRAHFMYDLWFRAL